MIWRSDICFSLLLLFPTAGMAGTVSGLVDLIDSSAAGRASRDLSGVVVWLEPLRGHVDPAPLRARMLQKDKTFFPHVLAIPKGSIVDFPNQDPIFHNAFSNFNGKIFDLGLYPPGKAKSVAFKPAGVVRVFCNIHPAMAAVIVVVDTPFFAVTDRGGHYTIRDIPPGPYRRFVFHERAAPETLASLTGDLEVGVADTSAPPLRISEAGYIPTPHANKFGKPYPRMAGDDPTYSIP